MKKKKDLDIDREPAGNERDARVLYVLHSMNNDGSSRAFLNLVAEMKRMGVEVGATVPHKEGYLYDKLCSLGVKIFYRRGYPSFLQYPSQNIGHRERIKWYYTYSRIILGVHRDMYKIIKEFKPDVVHTNSSAIDYALLGCYLTRTPHVWHVRELLVEGCNMDVFPSLNLLKWKIKRPFSHSIAVTKAVYDYYNMSDKDTVIYDGVINEKRKIKPSSEFVFPYFLTVGYVSEVKGILSLVRKFAQFAQSNKDIHLMIVGGYCIGDDYYEQCVKVIEEYGTEGRVHFLGRRDDVYELMASAEALFVCSKFEGFGFTPVEAMYCNTLVIGRNVGGVKEQFDIGLAQTGKEIALRFVDEEELPKLMSRALSEDFSEMKQRARKVVLDNYTISRNAQQILTFYKQITLNFHKRKTEPQTEPLRWRNKKPAENQRVSNS